MKKKTSGVMVKRVAAIDRRSTVLMTDSDFSTTKCVSATEGDMLAGGALTGRALARGTRILAGITGRSVCTIHSVSQLASPCKTEITMKQNKLKN